MKFPLKSPEEYGLPEGVEVIRQLESADQLRKGDVFSTGEKGLLYLFDGIWEDHICRMCNFKSFDAKTGREMGCGSGNSFFNRKIFLMRVPEGFLQTEKIGGMEEEPSPENTGLLRRIRLKLTELCHSFQF